jgi:nucleotide-binding universal stress UspA family protein
MFKKMLVPLDGSALSEEVVPLVKKLLESGAAGQATLFSVGEAPKATVRRQRGLSRPVPVTIAPMGPVGSTVISPGSPAYAESKDQAVERREQEMLDYLHLAGRPLLKAGRPVHAAVHFGDPAREIVDLAKRGRYDVIVMATHGRSGLRRTLQGSVTAEVVRSGVAPVLVVRPKSKRNQKKRRAAS